MNEREIKIPITRLKDYLNEVGITVTAIAELSGISRLHLSKCLSGDVDERNGRIRTMSNENIQHLQDALHQLSLELKYTFIYYNTDLEVCKKNGRRYCPDCVEQIKTQLSRYLNILPFMKYALGWSSSKVHNVMDIKKSISYGNISQDDCNRVNIVLAEIAARLDAFTLVQG